MRVYLFFLERYQNFLSLPYCAFFLILYQPQSAEFCEIVVAENRIGVNVLLSSWFILEFWVVASVRWMKCDSFLPCFRQMDDYPYATLGADGWFRCDGLHHPGFPTLLRDVLHHFNYMGFPAYRGCPYRQFGVGRCKVHVDVPAHPTDPTMTAWFTTARGDDLDNTLERAAHQALTEFCEHHLPVLGDTALALLPVRNEGNAVWSERVTAISDPEFLTHHAGWALTARYA
jgi:hypothetical protein